MLLEMNFYIYFVIYQYNINIIPLLCALALFSSTAFAFKSMWGGGRGRGAVQSAWGGQSRLNYTKYNFQMGEYLETRALVFLKWLILC